MQTSRSRRATELLPAVTRSEHLGLESAVMGAQIEQLPDLAGYLKIASRPEWRRVRLRRAGRRRANAPRPAAPARARLSRRAREPHAQEALRSMSTP